MTTFRDLFLYLAPGSDPADRVVWTSELSRTAIVPVPDVAAAVAVAAELVAGDGLDLIELYGGLGPKAAAAVLAATGDGAVPVGLVGVEYPAPPRHLVVLFEAPDGDPAADRIVHEHRDGTVTVVAVPSAAAAPEVAAELVAAGADRVEVCGGMGPTPAAAVMAAIGDRVPVAPVLFGFESLPAAAAYRARFEEALAAID